MGRLAGDGGGGRVEGGDRVLDDGAAGLAAVALVNGQPSHDSISPTLTYYLAGAGTSAAPTEVGSYSVVASFPGDSSYKPASASTTFTITQAPLTVTPANATKVYGQADNALTGTIGCPASAPPSAEVTFPP